MSKICIVCKHEILPNESARATGLGWTHLRCIFNKVVKVIHLKKGPKRGN